MANLCHLFFLRLAGNDLSNKSSMFFSGSCNFRGFLNRLRESSICPESLVICDVGDGLDLTISVDVVVRSGDDAVSCFALGSGGTLVTVAEL